MTGEYNRNYHILHKAFIINIIPLILSSLANRIAGIVDSVLAGHMLNAHALAAIKLVMSIPDQFITSLIILLGVGVSTVVMSYKAKREDDKANVVFSVSVLLSLIVSLMVATVLIVFARPIINFFTTNLTFVSLILDYYYPFAIFVPLEIVTGVVTYCIYLDKSPRFLVLLAVVDNVLNLMFDLIFAGLLDWGIFGFSLASGIGKLSTAVMLLIYYRRGKRSVRLDFDCLKNLRFGVMSAWETVQAGFSAAIAPLLILIRMSYIEKLILTMTGTFGMAVFTVFDNCENLVYMFTASLSQMMLLMCGMLMGEEDAEGIKTVFIRTFVYMSGLCLGLMSVVIIFPEFFFELYGMYYLAYSGKALTILRISAVSFLGTGLSLFMRRFFTGIRQYMVSTFLSVISSLMLIPVAFILTDIFQDKGIWFAVMCETYLVFLPLWFYLRSRKEKENLTNLLLIPPKVDDELFFMSCRGTQKALQEVPVLAKERAAEQGINEEVGEKLLRIIEALMRYIVNLNRGDGVSFDLRLRNTEKGLIIAVKDDGVLAELTFNEEECSFIPDAATARSLIRELGSTRIIGLNQTVITVNSQ